MDDAKQQLPDKLAPSDAPKGGVFLFSRNLWSWLHNRRTQKFSWLNKIQNDSQHPINSPAMFVAMSIATMLISALLAGLISFLVAGPLGAATASGMALLNLVGQTAAYAGIVGFVFGGVCGDLTPTFLPKLAYTAGLTLLGALLTPVTLLLDSVDLAFGGGAIGQACFMTPKQIKRDSSVSGSGPMGRLGGSTDPDDEVVCCGCSLGFWRVFAKMSFFGSHAATFAGFMGSPAPDSPPNGFRHD